MTEVTTTSEQNERESFRNWRWMFESDNDRNPTIFEAWHHQQQRIDELERERIEADKRATKYAFQNDVMALRLGNTESKLKIVVDAMKKYHEEMQHQGFEGGECLLEALKQIEVK